MIFECSILERGRRQLNRVFFVLCVFAGQHQHRLEELEKLVRDECEREKKMEVSAKALENVVKVMTRKVISLEKELVNVKDSIQNLFENKTKVGLGHKKTVKEKVNDSKEEMFTFDPKSASSPKDKDKGRKEEIKEHLFSCFKCNYNFFLKKIF